MLLRTAVGSLLLVEIKLGQGIPAIAWRCTPSTERKTMRFKYLLLTITLIIAEQANACECFPIDSASARELMNEVDFVIIGHAIRNVGFNSEVNGMWDQRKRGYNVLIEIDSVIKGKAVSKTVIVKQFGGNCDQIFEFGEQYLIVGNRLNKFVNRTSIKKRTNDEELPPNSLPPPPPPSINDKTVTFHNNSDDEVQFWNELANEQVILNTSMCSSFQLTSRTANYFLDN
jgi:hypothetical protein